MRKAILSFLFTSLTFMYSNKISAQAIVNSIPSTFDNCEYEWLISNEWGFTGVDTFKFETKGKYTALATEANYAYGQEQLEKVFQKIGTLLCRNSLIKKGVLAIELEIGINGNITRNHIAHSFDKELDQMVLKELEITNGKWRAAIGINGAAVNSFLMIVWKLNLKG